MNNNNHMLSPRVILKFIKQYGLGNFQNVSSFIIMIMVIFWQTSRDAFFSHKIASKFFAYYLWYHFTECVSHFHDIRFYRPIK